jgi:hypothetical protein
VGWSSGGIYGTQSWGYVAGIIGQLQWIQFRTISTIFDIPLPSPYSIPSPVVSVVAMALTEALAHFTLRFPLRFTNPSSILLYTTLFRFPPLFRTISTVLTLLYPPPYSIPSPVISVVTMAVTEVPGTHFTLRFPLRFTVPSSDFRTSPYLLQDQ